MRIAEVPKSFTAKDMILDLAGSLQIDRLEFVIYLPGHDGYGSFPRLRTVYETERVRRTQLEDIRHEMTCHLDGLEFGEESYALGLSSLVCAGGSQFHTPQADFWLRISDENLHRIYRHLEEIGQTQGYVIKSGNSYHFQGIDLMPEEFWRAYMNSLDDNFVDAHWVDSNLMDRGFSVLRLTPAYAKLQQPQVLSRIYPK